MTTLSEAKRQTLAATLCLMAFRCASGPDIQTPFDQIFDQLLCVLCGVHHLCKNMVNECLIFRLKLKGSNKMYRMARLGRLQLRKPKKQINHCAGRVKQAQQQRWVGLFHIPGRR